MGRLFLMNINAAGRRGIWKESRKRGRVIGCRLSRIRYWSKNRLNVKLSKGAFGIMPIMLRFVCRLMRKRGNFFRLLSNGRVNFKKVSNVPPLRTMSGYASNVRLRPSVCRKRRGWRKLLLKMILDGLKMNNRKSRRKNRRFSFFRLKIRGRHFTF